MISVTMLWKRAGEYTDPRYVEEVVRGISRHTTREMEFVVLTDTVRKAVHTHYAGVPHPVRFEPLLNHWPKHQHLKLECFRPELGLADRAVLTDLDNFFLGDLDEMLAYEGRFAARSTFRPRQRPQPQMSWAMFDPHHDDIRSIWRAAEGMSPGQINEFAPTGMGRGDQLFVYKMIGEYDRLDKMFPGQLESWKRNTTEAGDARILFAHGKPKPHKLDWRPFGPWSPAVTAEVDAACARFRKRVAEDAA